MERKPQVEAPKGAEKAEIAREARDAHEGDRKLDEYDKAVADTFPASDPPVQP